MKKYPTIWFCALVLALFPACSSTTENNLQMVLGRHAQAPVFLDCRPVSPTEVVFMFSQSVRVLSLNFDSAVEVGGVEEGREVKVTLAAAPEAGRKITADILVEDSDRNTLNVIVPFRARNDRIPAMVFNELRTEYGSSNNTFNIEFLEFYTLEAGNLGAMRLYIACQSLTAPVYEFPPVEVKAGEYVVLHLRTREEGCADETGDNLALSRGRDAHDEARDLWFPGNPKMLHKTEALWLLDQDDRIIDAVFICENPDLEWPRNTSAIVAAVEYLAREGAWPISDADGIPRPADAISSRGTTATRTICRDENMAPAARPENWYVTATSSATPGWRNSDKRYN